MAQTVCFVGHRKINITDRLISELNNAIENLITDEKADTFLFGSRSEFNDLCYSVVTKLKERYPNIRRIYVRGEYPYIDEDYRNGLLRHYEDTYYPEKLINAGSSVYVERNRVMIDESDFCIVYYDENYLPPRRKYSKRNVLDYQPNSGTKLAYDYAVRKKKHIINLFTLCV